LNIEPVIEFQELPTDDPKMRCPDISYAKSALHWEPKIELAEGLALTAQWLKSQLTKS
jgi:nucleoside-diphosphate-sugar epimerase